MILEKRTGATLKAPAPVLGCTRPPHKYGRPLPKPPFIENAPVNATQYKAGPNPNYLKKARITETTKTM